MNRTRGNRNITSEEGYKQLYADVMDIERSSLYTSDISMSDDCRKILNPIGDLKDSIDWCLDDIMQRNKSTVANVIKLAYGLDGNGKRTYKDITKELNWDVTIDRVGQVCAKGLRMLKHPSRVNVMMSGNIDRCNNQNDEIPQVGRINHNPNNVNIMTTHDPIRRYAIIGDFISKTINVTLIKDVCDEIPLSIRAYNCLNRGATTHAKMSEILLNDEEFDFTKFRNCGKKTAEEIKNWIAEWASMYIGAITYDDLRDVLEPYIIPNNMEITKIVEKSCKMYLFNMPISETMYSVLTHDYGCHSIYDIAMMLNDDAKFEMLSNNQSTYDAVMQLMNLYCRRLMITLDELQEAVKSDTTMRSSDDALKYLCLTKSMREKLNLIEPSTNYCLNGTPLGDVTNGMLYDRLKEFVDALNAASRFKLYEIFYDIGYTEPSDMEHELHMMIPHYSAYQVEQLIQIHRLFKTRALDITLTHAAFLWNLYSESVNSDWVGKEDDDTTWLHIITNVIINDKILSMLKA